MRQGISEVCSKSWLLHRYKKSEHNMCCFLPVESLYFYVTTFLKNYYWKEKKRDLLLKSLMQHFQDFKQFKVKIPLMSILAQLCGDFESHAFSL